MFGRLRNIFAFVAILMIARGCAVTPETKAPVETKTESLASILFPKTSDSKDAQVVPPVVVNLDVYVLELPMGVVSRNEAFWRKVDEDSVDPATGTILYNNGLRVGTVPKTEWAFFRDEFAKHPPQVRKAAIAGLAGESIELPVSKDIDGQVLFVFDGEGRAVGRTYDKCRNLFVISFTPTPRRDDSVRLTLCPLVRTDQVKMQYTSAGEEMPTPFQKSDRIYDVNLRTDLSCDRFMVVSPSAEAKHATSLGRAFLVKEDTADRFEQVLVIIPSTVKLGKGTVVPLN